MSRLSMRAFLRKSTSPSPSTSPGEISRSSTGEALIIHDNPLFSPVSSGDVSVSSGYMHLQAEEIEIDTGNKTLKLRDIIANVPFFQGIDSSQLRVLTERIVKIGRASCRERVCQYV